MYDPSKQYRCTIIRGKSQKEMDDLLPAYEMCIRDSHYTEIMEFLRGLNEKWLTVVMITHDMHLMLEYTPRALVFADGRLIADRSAAAVLCDPQLIRQAALKETSLFTLANQLGISPAEEFVQRFIEEDREVRSHCLLYTSRCV